MKRVTAGTGLQENEKNKNKKNPQKCSCIPRKTKWKIGRGRYGQWLRGQVKNQTHPDLKSSRNKTPNWLKLNGGDPEFFQRVLCPVDRLEWLLMHSFGMSGRQAGWLEGACWGACVCACVGWGGWGVAGNVRKREEKNRECDNSAGKIHWLSVSELPSSHTDCSVTEPGLWEQGLKCSAETVNHMVTYSARTLLSLSARFQWLACDRGGVPFISSFWQELLLETGPLKKLLQFQAVCVSRAYSVCSAVARGVSAQIFICLLGGGVYENPTCPVAWTLPLPQSILCV